MKTTPMKQYLKNILQLILSPTKGWEDISAAVENPDTVAAKGYYPLLAVAALSTFARLFYDHHLSVVTVVMLAVALFGTYFISFYVGRIALESLLKNVVTGEPNVTKITLFILYTLGLSVIIEIIENCVSTSLTPIKFLPLFVALIIYRGSAYMAVKPDNELRFLVICVAVLLVMPILIMLLLNNLIN